MATIRAGLVPDDVEQCVRIWVEAIAHRDGHAPAHEVGAPVREAFARPLVRFAIATGSRAGFATVESEDRDPSGAYLHYLAVDPHGTGSGVGGQLLADAISHAAAGGFTTLALEVREHNARAIGLYERAGFVATGAPVPHATAPYRMQPYVLMLR
ncbi:GNAT family N-acetyltransferase [Demequina salsinemoris]|uniref:GNAT family N-acetyltransferase n=1 Tax=Demequina salsinemoris TaxID=577470 RepID=UPI001364C29C|nr:GNAT family N-acetyltransferase [Demequina salsinemoris]